MRPDFARPAPGRRLNPMSERGIIGFAALLLLAVGSWYMARYFSNPEKIETSSNAIPNGYYLRSARILGTGDDGHLLYEIKADYAEQLDGEGISVSPTGRRHLARVPRPNHRDPGLRGAQPQWLRQPFPHRHRLRAPELIVRDSSGHSL